MSLRVRGRSRVIDVLLITALMAAVQTPAFATETHQFDVPTEDAPSAIRDFATQAHVQILVAGENVRDMHLHPVSGEFSTEQGLRLLLADSGLSPQYVGDRSIALVRASDANSPSQGNAKEGKKSSSGQFRVAQLDQGQASRDNSVRTQDQNQESDRNPGLTEIIVTAQKRAQNLLDVPVPVTAISAQSLLSTNQVRLQDYYTSIPGLSVTTDDLGSANLAIRGVTTGGYTSPTVGITVDDVPFGASSGLVTGEEVPDIDPSDLARIEVLRGPQGTLYGASSIGGLLKYVTVDPSFDAFSGRVEAGTSSVHNGSGLGYTARAAANIPLSDTFAIRASGFTREDPGYIDDPVHHRDGVNEIHSAGGHLAGLWKPSDDLSFKISALYQHSSSNGSSDVLIQPGLGDLQQDNVPGTGYFDRTLQAYSASITAKLGPVNLTSVTGYSINRVSNSFDYTNVLSALSQYQFNVTGGPNNGTSNTDKLTQEIRLTGSLGRSADWLVGGFFNHENTAYTSNYLAANFDTGEIVGNGLAYSGPLLYKEFAGFADLTFHLSERFDVQIGGRESQNRQTYSILQVGPYVPLFYPPATALTLYNPPVEAKDNSFTYLVTPQWKLSPDLMLYARLASGYRPGGPNIVSVGQAPPSFAPDKTENYEIGIKGSTFDHLLTFDASVYYIDWKNIQLQLRDPLSGSVYFANGSRAKSQGLELSVEARPWTGMNVTAWVALNDAKLTEPLPPNGAVGFSGDRLPDSSKFSGNISAQQDFAITGSATAFVGGSLSYVGDRYGIFNSSPPAVPPRQYLPSYARTDLRSGIRYDTWTLNLYVNNVTDKRGILSGGLGTLNPVAFNYIQPRIFGLSVVKTF
jgi:iron complex outermembrane receptor protein